MPRPDSKTSFSASVEIALEMNGARFEASHVGPDEIILDEPALISAGRATISVQIDGRDLRRDVIVTSNGATPRREIAISDA
jgi:hypothetical protein